MSENLKNYFDNLYAKDRNNMLSVDFNQSIDKIHVSINNDDLEDILLEEKTSDDGGIIAMTGFYYQMMVSVLYLGEVFQGKWDGMFLDHHQDIVLFNNSQKIVKFVQVKTKQSNFSEYDYKISQSWIPKLFKTGYNIKALKEYTLEFEIVSNCHYSDKNKYSLLPFYSSGNLQPCDDNEVVKKVIKYFSKSVIESIRAMLDKRKILSKSPKKRFYVSREHISNVRKKFKNSTEQKALIYFQNFNMEHKTPKSLEHELETSIPKILGFEHSQLSTEILNQVIAEFFNACYAPKDASIQLIKGEKLDNLRQYIKKKLTENLTKEYHSKSDEKILTQYFTKLESDYSKSKLNSEFITEFKKFVDQFWQDLKKILSASNLTMVSIINRYLKYNEGIDTRFEESECETHYNDLLSLLLFLKISIEKDLMVEEKNRHILSIELDRLLFLILGNNDDMRDSYEVIQNFKELFPRLDSSEKLRIANSRDVSIIISGQFDNDNSDHHTELKKEELDFSLNLSINNSKLDEMNTNNITDVQLPINILYAHRDNLNAINKTRKQYNNLKDMKRKIDEELKLDGTS